MCLACVEFRAKSAAILTELQDGMHTLWTYFKTELNITPKYFENFALMREKYYIIYTKLKNITKASWLCLNVCAII